MKCPKCGEEDLGRDEVDVGVGFYYGPYGCYCGWSEASEYDCSEGASLAQKEDPSERVTDQWGVSHSKERLAQEEQEIQNKVTQMLTKWVVKVRKA